MYTWVQKKGASFHSLALRITQGRELQKKGITTEKKIKLSFWHLRLMKYEITFHYVES